MGVLYIGRTKVGEFVFVNKYKVTLTGEHCTFIGNGYHNYNLMVTIEAVPEFGYGFVRWSDGSTENPRPIRIDGDILLEASTIEYPNILYTATEDISKSLTVTNFGDAILVKNDCVYNSTTHEGRLIFTGDITSIPLVAFRNTSNLISITIPNTVTSIEAGAFYNCSSLTSVVWNAKNCADFEYSSYAPFYNIASQITSFTFGSEVGHIPASLCYGMENLTSVIIPNSVTSIGGWVFKGCSSLKSVTIPNSVISLGLCIFYECSSLTSVVIGNSVTNIVDRMFEDCSSLTSIIIPNNIIHITNGAFDGCNSLTSIIVESGNTTYDSRNGCNAIIETATNTLIVGCQSTIIPDSVTSIGRSAFYGCSGLTSVTIPNSVTSIGDSVFYECSGLTSVTIPNSVTSIGATAFGNCLNITSITIGNSVKSLGFRAFYNCTSLTTFTYDGTKNQWNSISKGNYWNQNAAFTKVTCSDGEVSLI